MLRSSCQAQRTIPCSQNFRAASLDDARFIGDMRLFCTHRMRESIPKMSRVHVGEMTVDGVGIVSQAVWKAPEKIFLDFVAESASEGSESDGIERLGRNRPNRARRSIRLRPRSRGDRNA